MKNLTNYSDFINEKKTEMNEKIKLSKQVQDSIKSCCEAMMAEAKACHENENPKHTYEGYVNEAMSCMKEYMGSY